jgi:hypothetical protein
MKNPTKDALESAMSMAWDIWISAGVVTDAGDTDVQDVIENLTQNAIATFLTSLPTTARIVIGRHHFTGEQVKQYLWGATVND